MLTHAATRLHHKTCLLKARRLVSRAQEYFHVVGAGQHQLKGLDEGVGGLLIGEL